MARRNVTRTYVVAWRNVGSDGHPHRDLHLQLHTATGGPTATAAPTGSPQASIGVPTSVPTSSPVAATGPGGLSGTMWLLPTVIGILIIVGGIFGIPNRPQTQTERPTQHLTHEFEARGVATQTSAAPKSDAAPTVHGSSIRVRIVVAFAVTAVLASLLGVVISGATYQPAPNGLPDSGPLVGLALPMIGALTFAAAMATVGGSCWPDSSTQRPVRRRCRTAVGRHSFVRAPRLACGASCRSSQRFSNSRTSLVSTSVLPSNPRRSPPTRGM